MEKKKHEINQFGKENNKRKYKCTRFIEMAKSTAMCLLPLFHVTERTLLDLQCRFVCLRTPLGHLSTESKHTVGLCLKELHISGRILETFVTASSLMNTAGTEVISCRELLLELISRISAQNHQINNLHNHTLTPRPSFTHLQTLSVSRLPASIHSSM